MPYEAARGENDAYTQPGQGDVEASSLTLWQQLGAAIAPEHRELILTDPEQVGGRTVAKRRLSELADVVGPE